MAKIHIKKDGTPGRCKAREGNCPLGGANDHFDTVAEATQAMEARSKTEEIPTAVKKPASHGVRVERIVADLPVNSSLKRELAIHPDFYRAEFEAVMEAEEAMGKAESLQAERRLESTRARAEVMLVKRATEEFHDTARLPQSIRDAVWRRAWEDGHSSGLSEIVNVYEEQAVLVTDAYDAGMRAAGRLPA